MKFQLLCLIGMSVAFHCAARAAPLTAANVVVYRVGTGSKPLSAAGSGVFLDEYTPNGKLVQSIPMPTTGSGAHRALVAAGTDSFEGQLTRSADGRYLVLAGYGATLPYEDIEYSASSEVWRTIGRVDAAGNVDTSTSLSDYADRGSPRSVASLDGKQYWLSGGESELRYALHGSKGLSQRIVLRRSDRKSSDALPNADCAQLQIFNNDMYASISNGFGNYTLAKLGNGFPITGDDKANVIPGSAGPISMVAAYGFFMADLSEQVPGLDTLYTSTAFTGISKYSLVNGEWVKNGSSALFSGNYYGLTAFVNGKVVTLFATSNGGTGPEGGGELVRLVDDSGYNKTLPKNAVVIATAAKQTAFRGVALAPGSAQAAPVITVQQPNGANLSNGKARVSFGSAAANSGKRAKTFRIKNTGRQTLQNIKVSVTGKHPSEFKVKGTIPGTLKPGASVTFKVVFGPKAAGSRAAVLKIRSNDPDENPFNVKLSGVGK